MCKVIRKGKHLKHYMQILISHSVA